MGRVAYPKETLIEISEGKRSGGRFRRISEGNIKMDPKLHCELVDWIQLTQVMGFFRECRQHTGFINGLKFLD